jgi:hypothetical protein
MMREIMCVGLFLTPQAPGVVAEPLDEEYPVQEEFVKTREMMRPERAAGR